MSHWAVSNAGLKPTKGRQPDPALGFLPHPLDGGPGGTGPELTQCRRAPTQCRHPGTKHRPPRGWRAESPEQTPAGGGGLGSGQSLLSKVGSQPTAGNVADEGSISCDSRR